MSENKHTPEPWCISDHNKSIIKCYQGEQTPHGTTPYFAGGGALESERTANARRIVACVNRLAQFTTEQIEDFGYDLFAEDRPRLVEAQNEIHLLKKQRDELLAALKSISKITGDAGFNIGGPLEHCPGEIDHDEAKRLLILACEYLKDTSKAAHRAIASVKGGA